MKAFMPSQFYVAVEAPKTGSSSEFQEQEHFNQTAVLATTTRRITIRATARASIVTDTASGVTALLHGETYGHGRNDANEIVQTYRMHGVAALGEIHGSFVIVVCDLPADYIAVITDRVNSRKAYAAHRNERVLLASSPQLLPRERFQLDPTGVAWYLTHGTIYNYRTAHRGIRLLERASVHEITWPEIVSNRYWSYSFATPSRASSRELSEEMSRLVVRAVQRRLSQDATVFLALSAGYDSAGILGALGKSLHVPGVRCFSYAQGNPRPGSDEYVSAQMARCYGYSHRVVQSFDGDVFELLRQNVELGERTCEENDAWIRMAREFSNATDPILFVGDECLGWTDYRLASDSDVLHAVQIAPEASVALLNRIMTRESAEEAIAGMHSDGNAMLARCEPGMNRHDMKDFLYLDQRMPQTIMLWREFSAGQYISVVNPLLDNDLLDFMQTVPTAWRRQKLLYRRTMNRMYPEVFRFRRAQFASAQHDARTAVFRSRHELEDRLKSQPSRLDEIIDPAAGWQMLRELPDPHRAEFPTLQSRARRRAIKLINSLGLKDSLRRCVRPVVPIAPIHQTVWRWLVLRTALGR